MGAEVVQQVRRVIAICKRIGLTADFPLALIAAAVVFPIVFSINSACKRREIAPSAGRQATARGRMH